MIGNEKKWEMLAAGQVEYFFDGNGNLWRGPSHRDENLHYSKFDGFTDDNQPIWVLQRSDAPQTTLTAQQFEDFLFRKLRERQREAAAKTVRDAACNL